MQNHGSPFFVNSHYLDLATIPAEDPRTYAMIRKAGVLVSQLVEREAAAVHDVARARQGLGIAREKAVHVFGRLQMPVSRPLAPITELVDRHVVANAGVNSCRMRRPGS
jgi:hypothetical protein